MYIGDNPSQWLLATAGRLERLRVFDEESEMDTIVTQQVSQRRALCGGREERQTVQLASVRE